jgi:cytoskeletal protein RodZ
MAGSMISAIKHILRKTFKATSCMSDFSKLDFSFGEYLKQERLRQGLSLETVSAKTGIKIANLIALESCDRRKLPADAFVRGFIRIYAGLLQIDSQQALDSYTQEWGFSNGMRGEKIFLGNNSMAESSSIFANKQFLSYIFIVILVAAGFLSYKFFSPDLGIINFFQKFSIPLSQTISKNKTPPPIPSTLNNIISPDVDTPLQKTVEIQLRDQETGEELQILSAPNHLPETPSPSRVEHEDVEHTELYQPEDIGPAEKFNTIEQPLIQEQQQIVQPTPSVEEISSFDKPIATEPEPLLKRSADQLLPVQDYIDRSAFNHSLKAHFIERTWLRITIDQKEPVEYTFQPDEQHTWHANDKFNLFIGNAGGIKLSLNGSPLDINKKSGQTLKISMP